MCILYVYLFNISLYVDDLGVALNACRAGCCVGNVIINHIMNANDLVILAQYVAGLSMLLNICGIFGEYHDIIFNQKIKMLLWESLHFISKMLNVAHLRNGYFNGVLVKQVDSVKYIGHFLTCELIDDIGIRNKCRVLNVRGNILFRKFHMCSVPMKLSLFNYCLLFYKPHNMWWNYTKISVTKLQIAYDSILKMTIGLLKCENTSTTFEFTNTQCCQSIIRNLVFKFVCRGLDSISLTMHRSKLCWIIV